MTLLVTPPEVTVIGVIPAPAISSGSTILICCSPTKPGTLPNHVTSTGTPPASTAGPVVRSRPVM